MAGTPPHLASHSEPHPGTDEHARGAVENGIFWCGSIVGPDGARRFDLWSTYPLDGGPAEGSVLMQARPVAGSGATWEPILLFDMTEHGYDALFVEEEHETYGELALVASDVEVVVTAGYSIEWEEEKEDWVGEDGDTVERIDGSTLTWQQTKDAGFDFLGVNVRAEGGDWIDAGGFELA